MTLDIKTVLVLLVLTTLLMSATLMFGLGRTRGDGAGRWNAGLLLIAVGWTLIAARGFLPHFSTHALAGSLVVAGLSCHAAAIVEFDGGSRSNVLAWLPGPVALLVVSPLQANYATYTAAISGFLAFTLGAGAFLALHGDRRSAIRWILAASYAAAAAALLLRAAFIWQAPDTHPNILASDPIQSATFLMLFAATVGGTFAFLMLQLRRLEDEARQLAMHDHLTGLLNRRAFVDAAGREMARCARAGSPVSALMLDLDHFKRVNDLHGHAAGDRVLVEFSALLRGCLRREDVAARHGGEEFCALLPGAGAAVACEVAERIRSAVAACCLGGLPQATTVSIGIASAVPDDAFTLDALLQDADQALYSAKAAGRNRVMALPASPGGASSSLALLQAA